MMPSKLVEWIETMTDTTNTVKPTAKPETKPFDDFGSGRYSPLAKEAYQDLQRIFGLSKEVAAVVAKRIASDFGACMAGGFIGLAKTKIGKVNDDMKTTVKEAATSVKGVSMTNGLIALKAINYCNEASKNFIAPLSSVKPCEELQAWFDDIKASL